MTIFDGVINDVAEGASKLFGVAKGESDYVARAYAPKDDRRLDDSRLGEYEMMADIADRASGRKPSAAQKFFQENQGQINSSLQGAERRGRDDASSYAQSVSSDPALQGRMRESGQASVGQSAAQAQDAFRTLSAADAAQLTAIEQQHAIDAYLRGVQDLRKGDVDIYSSYLSNIAAAQGQNAATEEANRRNRDILISAGLQGGATAIDRMSSEEE